MTSSWFSSFIPALLLMMLAIFARARARSWLEPGPFFALVWSFFTVIPLIMAPGYDVWPGGVWWILVSALCVCCGDWAISGVISKTEIDVATESQHLRNAMPLMAKTIMILAIVGLLASAYTIIQAGYNLNIFTSPNFSSMSSDISVNRYSGNDSSSGILGQLLLVGVYGAPLIGGFLFATSRILKYRVLALLSGIPALFLFAVQTTRFTYILSAVLWIASYFAGKIFLDQKKFSRKYLTIAFIVPVVMVFLFGVGESLRVGETPNWNSINSNLATPATRSALFGHISVFSHWFHDYWYHPQPVTIGAYTFAGPFNQLGIQQRQEGLYDYSYEVESGGYTNIYTFFRGLIEDFTLPGALIAMFLGGIIGSFSYHRVLNKKILFAPLLVIFYAFSTDFMSSLFSYNSCIAALAIFAVVVYFSMSRQPAHISLGTNQIIDSQSN